MDDIIVKIETEQDMVFQFTEIPVEFVPYTGAYKPVNLGNQSMTAREWYFGNIYNKDEVDDLIAELNPHYQLLNIVTNGQISFTLDVLPLNLENGKLFINGVKYKYLTDYTIDDSTSILTRLNPFVLETNDILEYLF